MYFTHSEQDSSIPPLLFLAVLCLCDSPVLPLCYPKMNNLAQAEILGYKQPLSACGFQNDLWSLLGRHLRKKILYGGFCFFQIQIGMQMFVVLNMGSDWCLKCKGMFAELFYLSFIILGCLTKKKFIRKCVPFSLPVWLVYPYQWMLFKTAWHLFLPITLY